MVRGATRPTSLLAVALVVLVGAGACTGTSSDRAAHPSSTTPARRTAAVPDADSSVTFDCTDPIARDPAPPPGWQVFDGAVALMTRPAGRPPVPTAASGETDPAHRLFAKTGIEVHAGVRAEIIVPVAWRDRAAVVWGNHGTGSPTAHLVIAGCPGGDEWLGFPGGYLVRAPVCLPLVVATAAQVRTVHVPIGRPCPPSRRAGRSARDAGRLTG